MYAALLKNKLVLANKEAQTIRNDEQYRCPRCKKKVMLIISQNKGAFFKHVRLYTANKGEQEEHMQAKLQLKSALCAIGYKAQTEVALANGLLRADVLAAEDLSFEIQCAPLSFKEYTVRHKLYVENKIKDIWIVGKRHYLHQNIKSSQLIFLRENDIWGTYLLEVDSINSYLHLKYDIWQAPIGNRVFYQYQKFPLTDLGLIKLWKFNPKKKMPNIEPDYFRHYLTKQIQQKTNLGMKVAQKLYEQKILQTDLPDFLFKTCHKVGKMSKLEQYLKQ